MATLTSTSTGKPSTKGLEPALVTATQAVHRSVEPRRHAVAHLGDRLLAACETCQQYIADVAVGQIAGDLLDVVERGKRLGIRRRARFSLRGLGQAVEQRQRKRSAIEIRRVAGVLRLARWTGFGAFRRRGSFGNAGGRLTAARRRLGVGD